MVATGKASSAETRNMDPMLFQCWASVVDAGPALQQHWVNAGSLGCGIAGLACRSLQWHAITEDAAGERVQPAAKL